MANIIFNEYKNNLVTGAAAITGGATDLYVALVNNYSPDETNTWSSISSAEVSGTGYVTGGKNLTNVTVSINTSAGAGDDIVKVDADDLTWTSSTITATGAIIYKGALGIPTTVITYLDFGGSKSSSSGDFAILWNTGGILNYRQGS